MGWRHKQNTGPILKNQSKPAFEKCYHLKYHNSQIVSMPPPFPCPKIVVMINEKKSRKICICIMSCTICFILYHQPFGFIEEFMNYKVLLDIYPTIFCNLFILYSRCIFDHSTKDVFSGPTISPVSNSNTLYDQQKFNTSCLINFRLLTS